MNNPSRRDVLVGGAAVVSSAELSAPVRCRGRCRDARPVELRRPEIRPRLQAFRLRQPHSAEGRDPGDPDHADGGNQNFDTFNTLNVYVLRGDGAAGMERPSTSDERIRGRARFLYGLVARSASGSRPTSSPTDFCCGPRRFP